jgi:hypothetical protein
MPQQNPGGDPAQGQAVVADADRLNRVKYLLMKKISYLSQVIGMLLSKGASTDDAMDEHQLCVAWAHALNANDLSHMPDGTQDGKLLDAMRAVDNYAANSGALNNLLSAMNQLIAAYKA